MCLLSTEQIAIVTKDVKNEGINFSHLQLDLIDHVCCDIELHMDHGISFNESYEIVKKEFGIKGLRQIQQNTLMLIDKNYRIMKKSMKIIGVLALALMAFGAMFKIMHWPMAGVMLLASFVFVAFVFFPALLYVMYKEVNRKKQVATYIIAFVGGIIFMTSVLFKVMHWPYAQLLFTPGLAILTFVLIPLIIIQRIGSLKMNKTVFLVGLISMMIILWGILFKMMHWPGAGVLLVAGGTLLVLAFVPLFYIIEVRKSESLRIDFLFGIIAISHFIIFSFLLSLTASSGILIDFNYQDNSFRARANYLHENNTSILEVNKPEIVTQFVNMADSIYNELEEIKLKVVRTHYEVSEEEAFLLNKKNSAIYNGDNLNRWLLSDYNANSPLIQLKDDIEKFCEVYEIIMVDSLGQESFINQLFSTEKRAVGINGDLKSWEDYYFKNRQPMVALNTLSFWQYNIRLAENKMLSAVVNNSKTIQR